MDSPFIYTRPLKGEEFFGRQQEVNWLSANLQKGLHSMIVEPPFSGKKSLINQVFTQIQQTQSPAKICHIPLFNLRSWPELLFALTKQTAGSFVNTLDEWKNLCARMLPLNNPSVYVNEGKMNDIRLDFLPIHSKEQTDELLAFPEQLCHLFEERLIIHISDFQNVARFEDGYRLLIKALDGWKRQSRTTYVITASKVNAIRELSGPKEILKKTFEHITLTPIEEKQFKDYIIKGFHKAGRVIAPDLAEALLRTTGGHPFYTQYFAHICFINTKGYMNDSMFSDAYRDLLDILHHRFCLLTDDLTVPQISFLKAVTDGIERFCTAQTLETYGLHSSANVTRVRTALEKKEILIFIRNKPHFLDPIFKIWFVERFIPSL
ncbi:MAG: hypothetical protein FWE30_07435 [Bacteroidales bacterium]|nr:hypothetical protein [Bacteroidales bacterium]